MKKGQPNMADRELDRFFRKASDQIDVPYEPDDWEKLKAKLDQQRGKPGPNGSGTYRGTIALLSIVMVLGLMIGVVYLDLDLQKNPEIQRDEQHLEISDPADGNERGNPRAGSMDAEANQVGQSWQVTGGDRANLILNDEVGDIQNQQLATEQMKNPGLPAALQVIPQAAVSDSLYAAVKDFKLTRLNQETGGAALWETSPIPGTINDIKILDQNSPGLKETQREVRGGRFSAALVFAPDVSALKFNDIEGLGNSLGLNLEYFIHSNISLNIGALYAFKTYRGKGQYSGYIPSPESMKGNCWMLDVPLNIRYYLLNRDLGRWYISAGMSSYLMLREKYNLTYTSYSGYQYERKVDVRDGNRHYLGIVNFSMGYERLLSDKIALQVEPYLKLPVNGIGEGEINLKSSGVLIGIKYSW